MPVRITVHAYDRAWQRFKWDKPFAEKIARLAYEKGLDADTTDGQLKKYITQRENIKILSGNAFVFDGQLLITVFELPIKLKNIYYKQTLNHNYAPQSNHKTRERKAER